MTLILHAPIIYISVEWGFDIAMVELGVVGLILCVVLGLSAPISVRKIVNKLRATPWFPLDSLMLLFPPVLFFSMSSPNYRARLGFMINAAVWLLTGALYRLHMFPKAIELALAEAAPRQG